MADSVQDILNNYRQKFIDALHQSLEKHDRVSGGGLFQSVKASVKVFGQKVTLEISMEDYWKWVDEGRKAGSKQPPIEPILKFIRNRGLKPKGLKKKTKKSVSQDAQYRGLAFIIARSIKKKGIKPTHFASEVMEQGNLLAEFKRDLTQAVGRNIKIEIAQAIKE